MGGWAGIRAWCVAWWHSGREDFEDDCEEPSDMGYATPVSIETPLQSSVSRYVEPIRLPYNFLQTAFVCLRLPHINRLLFADARPWTWYETPMRVEVLNLWVPCRKGVLLHWGLPQYLLLPLLETAGVYQPQDPCQMIPCTRSLSDCRRTTCLRWIPKGHRASRWSTKTSRPLLTGPRGLRNLLTERRTSSTFLWTLPEGRTTWIGDPLTYQT